jgi:hypothetical protein
MATTDKQPDQGKVYRLKLTPEQQAELRSLTGLSGEAIQLTAEELEERIAPGKNDAIF